MPLVGALSFGTALVLSLLRAPKARALLFPGGLAAAVFGTALIVAQRTVCGAICPFCVITDVAGIALGAAAFWARHESAAPPRMATAAFATLSALVVLGTGLSTLRTAMRPHTVLQLSGLPDVIAREQRPGVLTIVEFADYECPFCREQHRELATLLSQYGARVRLVRKHVPLSFHQHANTAARAACCAEEQGRESAMSDALFRSEDISAQGCEHLASQLGLDMAAFRSCVSAERTTDRIERDRRAAGEAGIEGLPTMFVGHTRLTGLVTASELRGPLEAALRASGT